MITDPGMAKEEGLLPQDLPPANHPLLENNATVNTLADLIDARREDSSSGSALLRELEKEDEIDVQEALTFPHTGKRSRTRVERIPSDSDMDADARTSSRRDDDDDASYLTRADFESEMNDADPDPDADEDAADFIGDSGLDRAPDITGTVTGIARGMATHLPQDLGADGFQIEEPEAIQDTRALETLENAKTDALIAEYENRNAGTATAVEGANEAAQRENYDGGRIPIHKTHQHVATHDDALDATRQEE